MFYTIYKITCSVNNKIYIGKHQTKDLDDGYMGSGQSLRRAQKKYGLDKFTKEILFVFDSEEEMNAKEKELVTEEFCTREDTYNLCPGGKGGFGYINANGLVPIEAYRLGGKISGKLNKLNLKIESENKLRARKNNIKIASLFANTEDAKLKRKNTLHEKEHQKGSKNSQFGTCWIILESDKKCIKINKNELDNYLSKGWKKGRKMNW